MEFDIHRFETLASTNSTARRWVAEGMPEGTVVLASRQTAGRGRQGRSWVSLPGALLFSIIVRPRFPAVQIPRLGFYACVAGVRAADEVGAARTGIKWPNDLVMRADTGGGKIPGWLKWGGVLVETGADERGLWAVVGVGLNVGCTDTPTPNVEGGAALSELAGQSLDSETVLAAYLAQFAALYEDGTGGGWQGALEEWRRRDVLLGRRVCGERGDGRLEGVAVGVDARGALGVLTSSGTMWVDAGDIHLQAADTAPA